MPVLGARVENSMALAFSAAATGCFMRLMWVKAHAFLRNCAWSLSLSLHGIHRMPVVDPLRRFWPIYETMCILKSAHLEFMWEPRPVCCVQHSAASSLLAGLLQVLYAVMKGVHHLLGELETSKGVAWLPLPKDCMDKARGAKLWMRWQHTQLANVAKMQA